MARRLTNWDKIRTEDAGRTAKYRDVYGEQQLDRAEADVIKGPASRIILNVILTFLVFILMWVFISIWQLIMGGLTGAYEMDFTNMNGRELLYYLTLITLPKTMIALSVSVGFFALMHVKLMLQLKAQNALVDNADINQYMNDQHIQMPEEMQRNYDWFPDVGCTSDVQPSSMISHVALSNKGLNPVMVSKRAEADVYDDDGEVIMYKGEVLMDDNDNPIQTQEPMIDLDFSNALFTASGMPNDKKFRKFYDTTKIPYNPGGKNRDKLGKYNTVADLINNDWKFPWYEPQRPGGAYLVDTAPVG